jgi:N utilization substance protein B
MAEKSLRRTIRERVLQILYALEYNRDARESLVGGLLSDIHDATGIDFAQNLISRSLLHEKEADEIMAKRLANWELERLAIIDRLILRMGITEILYFTDIPPKVSINEAIELGKEFGTDDSGKFINGVLNNVVEDFKKSGKLHKAGRGLIDNSSK